MIAFILTQWKLILCGLLLAFIGVQQVRIDGAHTDLAQEQKDRAFETAQRAELAQKAEAEARRVETERQTQVQEAEDAAKTREADLKAAAAATGAELDRLRIAVRQATGRSVVPGQSKTTSDQPATTVADLLLECSAAYGEMANTADRHVSDEMTLLQAWPK